jgi:predicted nucleic acid-binding OB-fold protein
MSLATSLVDIANINSSVTRSSFSETTLDKLATLILRAGGLVRPLILERISIDKFEVLEGHFEYYAAVRASERDSSYEMVRAFVVEPSNKETIEEQIRALGGDEPQSSLSASRPKTLNIDNLDAVELKVRQDNLESRLDGLILEQGKFSQGLEKRIRDLESQIAKPETPLLEAFNTFDARKLSVRLKNSNLTGKIIEKIVIEREKKGEFLSFSDVTKRVKGFGVVSMLKVIDNCL